MINATKALDLLNTQECIVKLSISLGEFRTQPGVQFGQVYVLGLEYTHLHNIKAIKIGRSFQDINWEPEAD